MVCGAFVWFSTALHAKRAQVQTKRRAGGARHKARTRFGTLWRAGEDLSAWQKKHHPLFVALRTFVS